MNIYFGVIILVLCSFVGYRLSVRFTERRKFFTDFYNFNEKMINEISFTKKSLTSICNLSEEKKSDFQINILKAINNEKYVLPKYLKKNDKHIFDEFSTELGQSDKQSQINFLSAKRAEISDIKSECEAEETKYKKLYIKLGVLFGLIFLILSL